MKRMLVLFVIVLLCAPVWAQQKMDGDVSQKLMDMEHKWAAAAKSGDMSSIGNMLADDYMVTTPSGKKMNKTESLADMQGAKLDTAEVSDMQVRTYGNTAVVTGTFRGTGKDKAGKDLNIHEAWTDTWVNKNGKWQCVASQSSSLNASQNMNAQQ